MAGKNPRVIATALVALASAGCSSEPDYAALLPPAIACDPGLPGGVDPVTGVSYERSDMPCIGIAMAAEDFATRVGEGRFGGADEGEIIGNLMGFLRADCSEPVPNLYTWFEADILANGVAAERVGVRKKGFVGSTIGPGFAKPPPSR